MKLSILTPLVSTLVALSAVQFLCEALFEKRVSFTFLSPLMHSRRTLFCPDPANDFNMDYGNPQFTSSGWHIQGGARVSSKASFNFAGGFLEFDMDLSGAHGRVNNNFYATFPNDGHTYCDSGFGCSNCCAEMDFTENNGGCWQATTWHHDRSGHDHDGSAQQGSISSQVHVRASWSNDGTLVDVEVGANHHSGEGFKDVMSKVGSVLYSSQWTGWVPGSCPGDGDLGASSFSVSNLRLQASVVQGPQPRMCSEVSGLPNMTAMCALLPWNSLQQWCLQVN